MQDADDPAAPGGGPFPGGALDDAKPLRIDKQGRWFHGCEGIVHPAIQAMLRRCLAAAEGGGWEVRSKAGARPVLVEDTPKFVTAFGGDPASGYTVTLDDGTSEALDPATLNRDDLGVTARVGDGVFPARFQRNAYVALGHALEEGPEGVSVLPLADGGSVELT
jgi:hypothetical protein